jgi:hypothetical protein
LSATAPGATSTPTATPVSSSAAAATPVAEPVPTIPEAPVRAPVLVELQAAGAQPTAPVAVGPSRPRKVARKAGARGDAADDLKDPYSGGSDLKDPFQ